MDEIRYATEEEIQKIAAKADLTPTSKVLTYGGKDFAVLRTCTEIDPMFYAPESGTHRRIIFAMNLETTLRLNGVREYYYNVPVHDEKYMRIVQQLGAVPTSREPELRFKKVL